ncbi:MAG: hypothetical protein ACYC99_14835 [Candidatus Geothermincolia bacterium]
MRRAVVWSIVILYLALLLPVVTLAGCGGARNVSSPREALLGHWRNVIPGSGIDQYYSATAVTYAGKGSDYELAYTVVSENESEFSLTITLGQSGRRASSQTKVVFSKDRKTMDLLPGGVPEKLQYSYVDSRQKP